MNRSHIVVKIQEKGLLWVLAIGLKRSIIFMSQIPLNIISFSIVLIIRFCKPLLTIRIGWIDIGRIGGSYNAFWNLDYQEGLKRTLDIYYFLFSTNHSNIFWKKLWKQSVIVFPFHRLARRIDKINLKIPGGNPHNATKENWPPSKNVIQAILKSDKIIHYKFSKEEEILGAIGKERLGLSKEDSFVCYHVRDSAYLNHVENTRDWTYHNFRDANIKSYIPSMQELLKEGKHVLRMGSIANSRIDTNKTGIVDYVFNKFRSDFLDVFLSAKCEFFVGMISGIIILPEFFRKPIVYTNSLKICNVHSWVSNSLTIFKLLYSLEQQRLLSFQEIFEYGPLVNDEILKSNNLTIIDNTPDEITDVVVEMGGRLSGSWEDNPADLDRQNSFWSIYGKDYLKSDSARIGTMFLRKYEQLLF